MKVKNQRRSVRVDPYEKTNSEVEGNEIVKEKSKSESDLTEESSKKFKKDLVEEVEDKIDELMGIEKSYDLTRSVESMALERIRSEINDYEGFLEHVSLFFSTQHDILDLIDRSLPTRKEPEHYRWIAEVHQFAMNNVKFINWRMKKVLREFKKESR